MAEVKSRHFDGPSKIAGVPKPIPEHQEGTPQFPKLVGSASCQRHHLCFDGGRLHRGHLAPPAGATCPCEHRVHVDKPNNEAPMKHICRYLQTLRDPASHRPFWAWPLGSLRMTQERGCLVLGVSVSPGAFEASGRGSYEAAVWVLDYGGCRGGSPALGAPPFDYRPGLQVSSNPLAPAPAYVSSLSILLTISPLPLFPPLSCFLSPRASVGCRGVGRGRWCRFCIYIYIYIGARFAPRGCRICTRGVGSALNNSSLA